MQANPLADNPLQTRGDVQNAVRDLIEPLEQYWSPGGAFVRFGETGAEFSVRESGLEGYSRSLWGAAALAAGGGEFDGWDRYREGLVNGTDPHHPEYWGTLDDDIQKVVESSGIGVALGLAPSQLWEPLSGKERDQVTEWMTMSNTAQIPDSNWRFFRVLANTGLRCVDAEHDWGQVQTDLDRLDEFYLGDGWYTDGEESPVDYYTGWVMHVEGLLYAYLANDDDPKRSRRLRERAAELVEEFKYWFEADGRALPYGRSLTYRFAQAAFWGALALAGRDADLPWGEIRGLWLRNLRWWADQPIFAADGTLTLGYRYPTLRMTEMYNSPTSPYWALRAFLPLAVDADHPFWTADERPLSHLDDERTLDHANKIVQHSDDHVVALTGGDASRSPHKYSKFAYSTRFGFGVDTSIANRRSSGPDSTLLLSEDGLHFRARTNGLESAVDDGVAHARWQPWGDVSVESWVVPVSPWHVRVHRLDAGREFQAVEGGFALDTSEERMADDVEERTGEGTAAACFSGFSGIRTASPERTPRTGDVVRPDPNTNLLHPRTAVPVLKGQFDGGEHWFVTSVLGDPTAESPPDAWSEPPSVTILDTEIEVVGSNDATTRSIDLDRFV